MALSISSFFLVAAAKLAAKFGVGCEAEIVTGGFDMNDVSRDILIVFIGSGCETVIVVVGA